MDVALEWFVLGGTFAAIVAIVCRVNHMSRGTKEGVFWQHLILGTCLFASIATPKYALPWVVTGVLVFLLMGSARWRNGAPPGTRKDPDIPPPREVPPSSFHRIVGRGDK